MSQTFVTDNRPPRNKALKVTALVILALLAAFFGLSGFLTDRMWFESVGQAGVFDTLFVTRVSLFAGGAAIAAAFTAVNLLVAFRSRPTYIPTNTPQLERAVQMLGRLKIFGTLGVAAFIGLIAGSSAAAEWQTFLQWRNAQPFNEVDATFGLDVSYFAFDLPWWIAVQQTMSSIVLMTALVTGGLHYLLGNLRPAPRTVSGRLGFVIAPIARQQGAVLIALFLFIQAWGQWLDRFNLTLKDTTLITGLSYVDANVNLPALNILAGISVVVGLLFLWNVVRQNWTLPILGVVLLALSSLLLSGAWPAFVQQVQVRPDEQAKESPYISNNIQATRNAYGLSAVEFESYDAVETPDAETLKGDSETLKNIRLLDPYVMASTFEQLQQLKGFYGFAPVLDVSRYTVDGETRGTLLAVREVNLDGIPESQRNWVTNHLIYTHGIGLAAAYDNTSTSDGQPAFVESDVPPQGVLGIDQPRIYFGEQSPIYSIVGGDAGIELDYPDDTAPNGQRMTTYTGVGGVPVGSFLNKVLFAARFGEANILLSEQVTENSRILFNRTPLERVKAVAPWLTLDSDPYPAVVDGKIVWIIDGYTTSAGYPYSQYTEFSDAVSDSAGARSTADTKVNYIRNSVKATVDAYDGTVTLFAWDETDPVLKTWQQVFPDLLQPKSEMSADLLSQVRYPEDLFKVQRDILRKYHITDPAAFFTGENFWIIPDDPTVTTAKLPQPPYYLTLRMPGDESATFSLTSTFAPAKRPSLAAFMAVSSDANKDYGKIRVLQLPSQTTIPGPVQAQNLFESDAAISTALSLLRRGGSDTVQGNLLSLPVADGILYVQPVYVKSTGVGGFPLLRKVMVGFGQKVALADSLGAALEQVLGGAPIVDPEEPGQPDQTVQEKLDAALAAAEKAYADGQEALKTGDFAAYGAAQARLKVAIAQAQAAAAQLVESLS